MGWNRKDTTCWQVLVVVQLACGSAALLLSDLRTDLDSLRTACCGAQSLGRVLMEQPCEQIRHVVREVLPQISVFLDRQLQVELLALPR